MDDLIVHIEGIGWCSPALANWSHAATALREQRELPVDGELRPGAAVLPANERRRAPELVRLACEVADQACAMAARDAAQLPCVFASMHGDVAITDALCATLADDPLQLSPTRFHNSVHNAATGYWTVATQCRAASNAVSAWHDSFAAGLLEAAVEALADATPVLLVACDIAARGPLTGIVQAAAGCGVALVIAPARSAHTLATLRLRHAALDAAPEPLAPNLAALAAAAPIAQCLPLLAALAQAQPAHLRLANGAASALAIEVAA